MREDGSDGRAPMAGPAADAVRQGLDRIVLGSLRPILLGLGGLYALFTPAHVLLLDPAAAAVMAPLAAASSVSLFFMAWGLARWTPPARLAHPIGAAIALIVLINSLAHLHLSEDPGQTTNLLLLILGIGVLFLDPGWFAIVTVATFTGWFLVLWSVAPDPEWLHLGFAMIAATVLATAVLVIRVRTFQRVEGLHFRDRVRQLELESALDRTEAARRGEAEARVALEGAVAMLRESEERFRRLADATSEGVLIHQDGQVVDANRRAADLLGRSLKELMGCEMSHLVRPSGDGAGTRGRRADGTSFPVETSTLPTTHRDRPASVTAVRDVTERQRAEQLLRRALEEAEAISLAKSAFLANMSHELRTPLNAVIGFSNILRKNRRGALDKQELEYLQRIVANGEHLLTLIDDILDLSKIEARSMEVVREPVELEELVKGVVDSLEVQARKKGLQLRAAVPTGVGPVEADPRRLRQVLLNLAGNAVKFTTAGWVEVRVRTEGEDRVATRIEVIDTGIGIPAERLEQIFAPFHQVDSSHARAYGGTGLGLAISRSLCELMGFELTVSSREGEGSTFSIGMPPPSHGLGPRG